MGNCFGGEDRACGNCAKKIGCLGTQNQCGRCAKMCCKRCSRTKRGTPAVRVCPSCALVIDRGHASTTSLTPADGRPMASRTVRQPAPPPRSPDGCPHCKEKVDVSFIDSHIETCRQRAKLQQQPQSEPVGRTSISKEPVQCKYCEELTHPALLPSHLTHCDKRPETCEMRSSTDDTNELCIICFEEKRNIAFVPCGHWMCCSACTPRVQECPVCRAEIQTRVIMSNEVKMSVCVVCRVHIHPTFLDGHREVCKMRLREKAKLREEAAQQKAEGEEDDKEGGLETDASGNGIASSVPEGGARLCMLCNKAPREVATLPCAHYCMCHLCASTVQNCPTCCRSITSTIPLFT